MDKKGGPLLLEGHGLMMQDGRLALCMHAFPPSHNFEYMHKLAPHLEQYDARPSDRWQYEMFESGETIVIDNEDVEYELSHGGRVIIMDI